MSPPLRSKILITGASGGLAQAVVERLARHYHLIGVDPRPLKVGHDFPGNFYLIDYRQRKMAEVFRAHKIEAVVHLGRVPVTASARATTRYNLNVLGTKNLLELSKKYGVGKFIACSTFHVYGAHQHNHLYITEEDPLRASQVFPELSDAVELDNVSTNFMLRNPAVSTFILRPCNIIGPRINNTITKLLRSSYCPVLMGFDPLQQFIHEEDLARAVELCLKAETPKNGVYNIVGEGVIPYTKSVEAAGSFPVPIPHFLGYPVAAVLNRLGSNIPTHLLDYFRFPTIVSDALFRRDFGFEPSMDTLDALKALGKPA